MEKTLIIYNGKSYIKHLPFNVLTLRDHFSSDERVQNLLDLTHEAFDVDPNTIDLVYKYEGGKWYFYEHDFKCWEDSTEYRECPELDPAIQYELMMHLEQ